MLVVDTSAIMAILLKEDDADQYISALENRTDLVMSSATLVECSVVTVRKKGVTGVEIMDRLLRAARITIEPLTHTQAGLARDAFSEFGGILNFGDSFAYALAKEKEAPLLFKGEDFSRTDLKLHTFA